MVPDGTDEVARNREGDPEDWGWSRKSRAGASKVV